MDFMFAATDATTSPVITKFHRPMVIRPAESKDLDRVARVWHESAARMDGPAFEMPSLAAMRDRIDCELENGWKLYVAERDGPIAAMLAIKPSERVLDQIFVAPGEQGRGVGSTLLDFAKQTMSDGFTLRMATANSRAGRFYEQAGLTIIDEGHHPTSGVPVRYYGWKVADRPAPTGGTV